MADHVLRLKLALLLSALRPGRDLARALPVIALAAAAVFLMMGLVTFAYRDVANRHSHKAKKSAGHDSGHGAGH